MDVERHNLAQIEQLNQRGGRTLSVIDLMADGTITAEMAAFCWLVVGLGAGFLTGAVPGGAGKTTLMGTLLSFLPPGERILTVADPTVMREVSQGRTGESVTLLAHEIGSGHWFGYIWGREAVEFFGLGRQGVRCVSCLHADTPDQARSILAGLGADEECLAAVPLQLFMRVGSSRWGLRRRVSAIHCVLDGRLQHIYRWLPDSDTFEAVTDRRHICDMLAEGYDWDAAAAADKWTRFERHLRALAQEGVHSFAEVRRRVVDACEG